MQHQVIWCAPLAAIDSTHLDPDLIGAEHVDLGVGVLETPLKVEVAPGHEDRGHLAALGARDEARVPPHGQLEEEDHCPEVTELADLLRWGGEGGWVVRLRRGQMVTWRGGRGGGW
jgi:hypothetical protein